MNTHTTTQPEANTARTMTAAALRTAAKNLMHDTHAALVAAGSQFEAFVNALAERKGASKEEWSWFDELAMEFADLADYVEEIRAELLPELAAPDMNALAQQVCERSRELTARYTDGSKKTSEAAACLKRAYTELRVVTAGLEAYAGLTALLVVRHELPEKEREFAVAPFFCAREVELHTMGFLKRHYSEAVCEA